VCWFHLYDTLVESDGSNGMKRIFFMAKRDERKVGR
jgi:hypothetical protein